jgi:hypothetical protein
MFAIISFLLSPSGKIVGVIGLIITLIIGAMVLLKVHDNNIRREALENFNKQQLEMALKSQEDFNRQTRILQETQNRLVESLSKSLQETERAVSGVDDYLSSTEAKKNNKDASIIIKETLKRLGAPQ